jgi:hypothetical protein
MELSDAFLAKYPFWLFIFPLFPTTKKNFACKKDSMRTGLYHFREGFMRHDYIILSVLRRTLVQAEMGLCVGWTLLQLEMSCITLVSELFQSTPRVMQVWKEALILVLQVGIYFHNLTIFIGTKGKTGLLTVTWKPTLYVEKS